jgi:hypothetical protein
MDIAAKVTGYGGHEWVARKPKAVVLVCCAATISHLPSLQKSPKPKMPCFPHGAIRTGMSSESMAALNGQKGLG